MKLGVGWEHGWHVIDSLVWFLTCNAIVYACSGLMEFLRLGNDVEIGL